VGLRGYRSGLFVQVAHELDICALAQGFIEVHGPAAGKHEDILNALVRYKLEDVVGQLCSAHWRICSCEGTSRGHVPLSRASTTSRTEPAPPDLVVTTAALRRATGWASAGVTANPQISRAATSFVSSPMKQTSASSRSWRAAKSRT